MTSPTQRTKLFGLKKLRKIEQFAGKRAGWKVSPHKVYGSPEQFRMKHMLGKPRLLLRTDEIGKSHKFIDWSIMPRNDIHMPRSEPQEKQERDMRAIMSEHKKNIVESSKARFIVHPTLPREKIGLSGAVQIEGVVGVDGKKRIFVQMRWGYPDPYTTIHRGGYTFGKSYVIENYHMTDPMFHGRNDAKVDTNPDPKKSSVATIKKVEAFVQAAIASKQLRLSRERRKFTFSFLRWKGEPKELEFYDLIETVDTYPTPKKSK